MSDKIELNSASAATAYEPGLYAIHYRDNWDGEGDTYHILAELSEDGTWSGHENGCKLLQFQGDEILQAWPLRHEAATAELSSIEAMCRMIEEREWAEHVGKGAIGRRVESVITTLHNELQDAQKAAAKQPAPAAVPDGWKMVPVKPTIEMVEAGYEASVGQPDRSGHARAIEMFDAMLAAAPAAEQPAAQEPAVSLPSDVRTLLEELQWQHRDYDDYYHKPAGYYCPDCGAAQGKGHFDCCEIDRVLAMPAAEQPDTIPVSREDAEVIASFFETGGSIRLVDAGHRVAHKLRAMLAKEGV